MEKGGGKTLRKRQFLMFSQTVQCLHKVGKHYVNEIRFLVGEKQKQTVEGFVGILLLMSLKCFN